MPSTPLDLNGLDHYAINIADLQRSADWYEDVLGLHILHKWNTTWMVGRGNLKVGLFLRPEADPQPDINNTVLIQHVAFSVDGDKFSDIHQYLLQKGLAVTGPEDSGIAYSIFLQDPDGHKLEITTYHAS
ncbi:VOC family protein [Rhizobium sp. P28RR-XV]|uniref:VOC family protein n=1 Tax=Rhizobium sp. P28RR-XV TaxID=2726737 RepID=UPI001456D3A3|nr:VOC family protein [Rhizobium sp. P28RR-XV]NLR88448.1 hypothetical protein [Rhizobium sp. P28RR-XV]